MSVLCANSCSAKILTSCDIRPLLYRPLVPRWVDWLNLVLVWWSNFFIAIFIPYHCPRGKGLAHKWGGGGEVLRSEYQAGYWRSTLPKHSLYQSWFTNKFFGLDAMNNLRKSIRPCKNISVLNYEFNLRPVFASISTFTIQHTGQFLNPLSVLWRNELSKESQRDVVLAD